MFSLSDLARKKYVVFNIESIPETTDVPSIASNAPPKENVDVSTLTFNKEILFQSLSADSLLDGDQELNLGDVYSVGYGLNFAQNRANIPRVQFTNENGGIVTRGYVGNNAIALPGTTGTLILP
jgi:hypothetical protein